MTEAVEIGGRRIGSDQPPLIVAEMSGNHNQSVDRALEIVEAAARAGVDAVKLQTYTADTMTLDVDAAGFRIDDPDSPWSGHTLYSLYNEAATPWEWHEPIFKRCRDLGLTAFSTPFDASAVEFLESLRTPAYKIASFEIVDLPLIQKVAATGKPMIVSTGMATVAEIDEAVRAARDGGCRDLVLLKCTSVYPASPETINLATMAHMRDLFSVPVGLSDHTMGVGVAVAAVALGAAVIEKHFTLRRDDGGVDAAFSMEPEEMAELVEETKKAWKALGRVRYGLSEGEKPSLRFRRSLYVTEDIREGDMLTSVNMRSLRPGDGLPPKYHGALLGKRVLRSVKKGTPVTWDLVG